MFRNNKEGGRSLAWPPLLLVRGIPVSGERKLQGRNAGWREGVEQAATAGLGCGRGCWLHGVGMREVIVVVDVVAS